MNHDRHTPPRPIAFDPAARDLGVLVGFDGSDHSVLALRYAALEARRSGRTLTVITAFSAPIPVHTTLGALPPNVAAETDLDVAKQVLRDARERLQDYPGRMVFRTERGEAAAVLLELSQAAQLVVVGARGRGGFLGRIMGSVASALPAHARCPTIVVPRQDAISEAEGAARFIPRSDSRPVVVGVDGSHHSRVAALHAAQTAQDRGATLELLLTIPSLEGWLDWYPDLDPIDPEVVTRRQSQLQHSLRAEAAWLIRHHPRVAVTTKIKPGDAVAQLSRATQDAQLTVVGARGRSRFTGALLGSVSSGVLMRATGPVMVVPDLEDERLADQPGPLR